VKLSEIAARFPDCELDDGGLDPEVTGLAPIWSAQPGQLTYLSSPKYREALQKTRASAVILDRKTNCDLPSLRAERPRLLLARVLTAFHRPERLPVGVHPSAILAGTVELGREVAVGPGVVVGERVRLGDGAQLHPNVVVYDDASIGPGTVVHANCVVAERTRIGADCTIYPGAVIGADGFGFELEPGGSWFRIPQTGSVVIEDRVEIGCLTTIDRPALGVTTVAAGTKVDNLVMVGHGCRIGPDCLIVAQVALAGGVTLGDHVVLGGQVGIAEHVSVGPGSLIGAKSGVVGDVEAGSRLLGAPAMPERLWKRMVAVQRDLPELLHQVRKLEQRVIDLEKKLDGEGGG
jgi:UDP-3-O-[3-hydroxymyristoyl] glucosamine N-acyltransferase